MTGTIALGGGDGAGHRRLDLPYRWPVAGAAAASPAETGPDEAALKYALLSVYYASIDEQFSITGAPSVFVPPEMAPLPLGQALDLLAADESRLEQALWQIVRTTRIPQAWEDEPHYPREIARYLARDRQRDLDRTRAEYRAGASVLAACLRACHHDDRSLYSTLRQVVRSREIATNPGFVKTVELLLDQSPEDFSAAMDHDVTDDDAWHARQRGLRETEGEVALGIAAYVEQLAAAAAWESFVDAQRDQEHHELSIYPVASRIVQSTDQLWTTATVTTLVHGGDFDSLLLATEPDQWHDGSEVIQTSRYVSDPYSLDPGRPRRSGADGLDLSGLLHEVVGIAWGSEEAQQSRFENVLNVERTVAPGPPGRQRIDVSFSLCRSISSEVLWDSRRGGITLDEGFLRVVPLGANYWRVTSRKLLRFSDRTPYSGANGWTDFGQMLNYLAPAALSWWVETETYSLRHRAHRRQAGTTEDGTR